MLDSFVDTGFPMPTPTIVLSVPDYSGSESPGNIAYQNGVVSEIQASFTLLSPIYVLLILFGVVKRLIRGRI